MKYKKEIDYTSCHLTWMELVFEYIKGAGICVVIAALFYKSIIAFLCFLPLSHGYVTWRKKQKIKVRREKLRMEFLEGIRGMAAALNAGYSVENSFREAYRDLSLLYSEEADIMREFSSIIRKIQMNCTVESALEDFADRSDVDEIRDFAEVFVTAKRTGGNIIKIIKNTCRIMEENMEIQREIDISIAGKKYEAEIMNMVPLGMIAYMWFFSADFMKPMYHNVIGIAIMTMALVVYFLAFLLSKRILKFQ